MPATPDTFPLLKELLADQQRLDTPVARFAAAHGSAEVAPAPRLIPLSAPQPGEQYAFEVDLDACTGCKSCVAACHSLNGLDEHETWRDVGLIVGAEPRQPFTQTITTACHHCADAACLNGCPVLAYEKDPVTGIVRHLDDQCIGCSYCVLKCPYDVPKYSSRLGIVRKCDMCHGRLAHGEAPACAQACPTHAIRITTVTQASAPSAEFLPCAPAPEYTRPTTRYVTRRTLPANLVAADAGVLRVQPAHWPLVALLTFMPAAVGGASAAALAGAGGSDVVALRLASFTVLAGALGLLCSVLHLGRPLRAWRVFLGLRSSWLSREAVLFGAWLPLATAAAIATATRAATLAPYLLGASAAVGVLGLSCSAMLYIDTRRRFWRAAFTVPRFFGSAVVLGLAAALTAVAGGPPAIALYAALVAAVLGKLLLESEALAPLNGNRDVLTPALASARLLTSRLRGVNEARLACALAGCLVAAAGVWGGSGSPTWLAAGGALLALGEFLERSLYFRAVDAPKMPGVTGPS